MPPLYIVLLGGKLAAEHKKDCFEKVLQFMKYMNY